MRGERVGMNAVSAEIRRRRSPKGDARRTQILQAAMRIFSRDGYQSAAIATVAEEVGLSLPGLLHHFPSKVELLLAILERRDNQSHDLLGPEYPHWREMLRNLCLVNRRNADIPGVVRAFSILNAESLIDDHPAAQWFRKRSDMVKTQFARSLAAGIAAGEVRADVKPSHVALQLISMMDGLQILWLRSEETEDMIGCFEDFVGRLIAGIETSAPV
jgi:AcrR family transcriptional regulator